MRPVFLLEETISWKFRGYPKTSTPSGWVVAAGITATVLFSPREVGTKGKVSPWSLSVSWQPWLKERWHALMQVRGFSSKLQEWSNHGIFCFSPAMSLAQMGKGKLKWHSFAGQNSFKEQAAALAMPHTSQCCRCGRLYPVSHFGKFTATVQCENKPKK